jgi:hypothetical protein
MTQESREYHELVERAAEGDTRPFIESMLRIQDKAGRIVPLHFNDIQEEYWHNRTEADIVLKPRQVGFTTLTQAEMFTDAMVIPGLEVKMLAQREESGKALFEITRRFMDNLPDAARPEVESDSTMKLSWRFPSGSMSVIEIGTAKSRSFGRGRPAQRALFTEVGLYEPGEEDTMLGIISAMPFHEDIGARFVEESTANGMSGVFYEDWQEAEKGAANDLGYALAPHFYPWFMMSEYQMPGPAIPENDFSDEEIIVIEIARKGYGMDLTDNQIRWRRRMVSVLKGEAFFLQEYPETPEQAFRNVGSAVFDANDVLTVGNRGVAPPLKDMPIPGTSDGRVKYWEWAQPMVRYIVCVDQASGEYLDKDLRPTDYQVITVWDVQRMTQVCVVRGHIEQKLFSELVAKVSEYYNYGLIVIERNHAQYGFFDLVRIAGGRNVYFHYGDGKEGYPVNPGTKPLLISNMQEMLKYGGILPRHDNLVKEMMNYRWQGTTRAKAAASPGGNDDELMTAMFAAWPDVITQANLPFLTGPAETQYRTESMRV